MQGGDGEDGEISVISPSYLKAASGGGGGVVAHGNNLALFDFSLTF